MAHPPTFKPCIRGCGESTMSGGVCVDCMRKESELGHAIDATESTIPDMFTPWAKFGHESLRANLLSGGAPYGLGALAVAKLIQEARDAVNVSRVILRGGSGRGKTTLVVAMARAWARYNRSPATFIYAMALSAARMRTRLGQEAEIVRDAIEAPLVILDDVGAGKLAAEALEEIVHQRHQWLRPTWVTTWMTEGTTMNRFGDGFTRRICEGARLIDFGGAT